jgi:hypothetical protein
MDVNLTYSDIKRTFHCEGLLAGTTKQVCQCLRGFESHFHHRNVTLETLNKLKVGREQILCIWNIEENINMVKNL